MNGPVVLIADNDRAVGGLLRDFLSLSGAEVHMVEDGEAAKERLARGGIDVLVCDLDMPRASGQDVAAWLATQPQQPVMIVVSGYVDEATRGQLAVQPFVKHVWSKPFDLFAFRDAVLAVPRGASPAALAATAEPAPEPLGEPAVPAAGVEVPPPLSFLESCSLPGVPRPPYSPPASMPPTVPAEPTLPAGPLRTEDAESAGGAGEHGAPAP